MAKDKICNLIEDFFKKLGTEENHNICPLNEEHKEEHKFDYYIYNEFSLQHELGIYIRDKLDKNEYKVLFEKNVKDICDKKYKDSNDWEKHEIDILIVGKDKDKWKPFFAIELKFPTNGQYPEQMKAFINDIDFMRQVKERCQCKNTYCLTLVNDHNFYMLSKREQKTSSNYDNYLYFRGSKSKENYPKINWNTLKEADDENDVKCYLIDIGKNESIKNEQDE